MSAKKFRKKRPREKPDWERCAERMTRRAQELMFTDPHLRCEASERLLKGFLKSAIRACESLCLRRDRMITFQARRIEGLKRIAEHERHVCRQAYMRVSEQDAREEWKPAKTSFEVPER